MNCYLVVGNSGSLTSGDQALQTRLGTTFSFTVTIRDDSSSAPSSTDLVVLSGTCSGTTLGSKYKTYAGPIVSFIHTAHDAMDWSQGAGAFSGQTQIDVINDTHPIAVRAGLSIGLTTVYDTSHSIWSNDLVTEQTTATVIANHASLGGEALYAFDTGDLDTDSRAVEDRRVAAPFLIANADPPLNATGWAIVDESIIWAADLTEPLEGASSATAALSGTLAEPLAGTSSATSAASGSLTGGVAPTGPPPEPMPVITQADRVALIEADRVDVTLLVDGMSCSEQ